MLTHTISSRACAIGMREAAGNDKWQLGLGAAHVELLIAKGVLASTFLNSQASQQCLQYSPQLVIYKTSDG